MFVDWIFRHFDGSCLYGESHDLEINRDGAATQLARLRETLAMTDSELAIWAQRAFLGRWNVAKVKETVDRCILDRTMNQGILNLFSPEQEKAQQRKGRRGQVDQATHHYLKTETRYWEKFADT